MSCDQLQTMKGDRNMNMKQFEERLRKSLKGGGGITWYPYDVWNPNAKKVEVGDLLNVLKRVGFQNANYKKEMRPANKYLRKIVRVINSGQFYIMKHPSGTMCYIGWHWVGGCKEKQLWIRVVGINEISR